MMQIILVLYVYLITNCENFSEQMLFPHLSDLMRLGILFKTGGYYVDTDTLALKPFMPFQPLYAFMESGRYYISTNFFVTTKHHPIMWNSMRYAVLKYFVCILIHVKAYTACMAVWKDCKINSYVK